MKIVRATIAALLCLILIAPFGLQINAFAESFTPPADTAGGDKDASSRPVEEPDPTQIPEPTDNEIEGPDPSNPEYSYVIIYNTLLYSNTYLEYKTIVSSIPERVMTVFLEWLDKQSDDVRIALKDHISELMENDSSYFYDPIHSFLNVAPCINNNSLAPGQPNPSKSGADDFTQSGGIGVSKDVMGPDLDDSYTITLEAFTTGTVTTTEEKIPADIVLVLDVSGSMEDSFSTVYSYQQVPQNTGNQEYVDNYSDNLYVMLSNGEYRKVTVSRSSFAVFGTGYYRYTYSWLGADGRTKTIEHSGFAVIGSGVYSNPAVPAQDSSGNTINYFYTYAIDESLSISRIDALKNAVTSFINTVKDKAAEDGVAHRIAIVKFAGNNTSIIGNDMYQSGNYTYNNSQTVIGFTEVTASGATQLINLVNALEPGGATHADYGMQHAKELFDNGAETGHTNVVVMFTDGQPTSTNGFEDAVANAAISASNDIKSTYYANVYTVGVFEGANGSHANGLPANDTTSNKTNRYMHLVSSNYVGATSLTNIGTYTNPAGNTSYYLSPENAEQLTDVFQSIANSTASAGAVLNSDTVIRDIVAPSFMLPAGTDESSIQIRVLDAVNPQVSTTEPYALTSIDGWLDLDNPAQGNRSNQHLAQLATVSVEAPAAGSSDQRSKVNVSGFDFGQWCLSTASRPETYTDANGISHTVQTNGKKIVITFKVVINPDFLGGNGVDTNGPESGIYVPGKTTPEIEFPQPEINVPIGTVSATVADKSVYLLGAVTEEELLEDVVVSVEKHGSNGDPNDPSNFVRCRVVKDPVTGTYGIEPLVPGVSAEMCAYLEFVPTFTFYASDGSNLADVKVVDGVYYFEHDCRLYELDVVVRPTKPVDTSLPGTPATEHAVHDLTSEVFVYIPVLNFRDTHHWYFEEIDVSDAALTANNFLADAIVWQHTGRTYDASQMSGEQPSFGFEYSIPSGSVSTGTPTIVTTPNDIPVNAVAYVVDLPEEDSEHNPAFTNGREALASDQYEFGHQACSPACDYPLGDEEFLLHIDSCEIDVTKAFSSGNAPSVPDSENFLFEIVFTGTNSTAANGTYRLAVKGGQTRKLVKLPRGSYTVSEVNSWAWRYAGALASQSGTLTLENPVGTHTFTNTDRSDYWLSDEAAVNNSFDLTGVKAPVILPDAILPEKEGIVYEEEQ